jgi:hypothetical protein
MPMPLALFDVSNQIIFPQKKDAFIFTLQV